MPEQDAQARPELDDIFKEDRDEIETWKYYDVVEALIDNVHEYGLTQEDEAETSRLA